MNAGPHELPDNRQESTIDTTHYTHSHGYAHASNRVVPTPVVELRALTKRYEEGNEARTVIQRADARIHSGEFVALSGPSGSGKTTLLNLIGGIDTPTSGEALIDAVPITSLSEKERTLFRRKNIGFVFQSFNLIPTLSVGENLLLPLQLNGFPKRESDAKVLHQLDSVGLKDRIDSYPDRLSGGEKQRVAIARALVHDPLLILADEPTGNLDADTGSSVMDLLESLIQCSDKTLMVVSHSELVFERAQRVFSIEEGQLKEQTLETSPHEPTSGIAGMGVRSAEGANQ